MNVKICDRCGKRICEGSLHRLMIENETFWFTTTRITELCDECYECFKIWMEKKE